MNEKKLTDEDIVKAYEYCIVNSSSCVDCPYDDWGCAVKTNDILEVVNRQKAEIERLTSLYDGKSGFMTSSIGDLPLTVAGLRKAVDEISRLLVVQGELQDLNIKYYNDAKDLRRENAELQKQVDELTDKLGKVLLGVKADEILVAKGVEQAVKDTAKEIFEWLQEHLAPTPNGLCILRTYLKERYGVEVE